MTDLKYNPFQSYEIYWILILFCFDCFLVKILYFCFISFKLNKRNDLASWSQVRPSSMKTPTNLEWRTRFILLSPILMSGLRSMSYNLLREPISLNSVFVRFTDSLFVVSHLLIFILGLHWEGFNHCNVSDSQLHWCHRQINLALNVSDTLGGRL